MLKSVLLILVAAAGALCARPAWADPAPFDLSGPSLKVSVTRNGTTLPISAVPQLAGGDKVKIEASFPKDETAHYLLVASSLRDPTNPPPDQWFAKSETWKSAGHGGGPIELTVPTGAQHLVVFLAPATSGDFTTLRAAVKGRPGAFVRAAQDLEQASVDRGRFETYLSLVRKAAIANPEGLSRVAPLIASSLRIKINEDCLQRESELQAACLLDAKQSIVLGGDDGSTTSPVVGAATDLATSFSWTPAGGQGYYTPYIGAIHEIIGIFGAMHTARYQYIPALGIPNGDAWQLMLNAPPSFVNPKSVLMAALPEVKQDSPPVLQRPANPISPCLGAKGEMLPLLASPLFYYTSYARDLKLRVDLPGDHRLELALTPDAAKGGFIIQPSDTLPNGLSGTLTATVHGYWGFEPFNGPNVTLETPGSWQWQDHGEADGKLILSGAPSSCVAGVSATNPRDERQPATWKAIEADKIAITLPPGELHKDPIIVAVEGPAGTTPARLTVSAPNKPLPPRASIIAHDFELRPPDPRSPPSILLDNPGEIPADARLSITLKAAASEKFTGHESLEIRASNGDQTARLTLGDGLTLVDSRILIATLTPAQSLGGSAYGPLRVRLVRGDAKADWLDVGTLVRLPHVQSVACPPGTSAPCILRGDGLYLLASVSATQDFESAVSIPEGFPGFSLNLPRPRGNDTLFVRLHDAPELINHLKWPKS